VNGDSMNRVSLAPAMMGKVSIAQNSLFYDLDQLSFGATFVFLHVDCLGLEIAARL
jgi:hypothetical protein